MRTAEKLLYLFSFNTSFHDRIYINNKTTRTQLKMFTTKKCISQHEFTSLLELLHLHAPSSVKLITTIAKEVKEADTAVSYCKHWINLLQAISSASPACVCFGTTYRRSAQNAKGNGVFWLLEVKCKKDGLSTKGSSSTVHFN